MKKTIFFLVVLLFFLSEFNYCIQSSGNKYYSYGINGWFWDLSTINLLKKAHLLHYRIMVPWRCLEPENDKFTWNGMPGSDRSSDLEYHLLNIKAANRNAKDKVRVSLCIYDSPIWARKDKEKVLTYDVDEYVEFTIEVLKLADRIIPGCVVAVEVENEEPTGAWVNDRPPCFGTEQRDPSIYYANILKKTYQAIKSYNPEILVIMDGIWGDACHHLDELYQLGCKGYFDRINLHYYNYSDTKLFGDEPPPPDDKRGFWHFPTVIGYLKYLSGQHGDNLPIWITEFAWQMAKNEKQKVSFIEKVLDMSRVSGIVEHVDYYKVVSQKPFEKTDEAIFGTPRGILFITTAMEEVDLIKNLQEHHEYGQQAIKFEFPESYNFFKSYIEKYPVWDKKEKLDFIPHASNDIAIKNSGFEDGRDNWLGEFEVTNEVKKTGNSCAKIKSPGIFESVIYPIEPLKLYELTFWIKIEGKSLDSIICMPFVDLFLSDNPDEAQESGFNYWRWGIVDTRFYPDGWRMVRFPVIAGEDTHFCRVRFKFDGEGTGYIDDIKLSSLKLQ